MSRSEKVIFWIAFSLLFSVLAWWKCLTWVEGYSDNVLLVDLLDNIAHRGLPFTQVQASLAEAVDIWNMKADELCALPLKLPAERDFNYFRWHPYVILYAIAPLAWFIPSPYVISSLIALSFVGMLAAAYWLLRQRGVNPWFSLAFLGLVLSNPGWCQSLQGQTYVDRLFLLPAMLLLIALFSRKAQMKWILLFGILSLLITERVGVICGAFLLGASILYWRKLAPLRRKIILMGFGCVLYSFFLIKLYVRYYATAAFSNNFVWSQIEFHLSTPPFVGGLAVLLIVNFAFLGLFSVFEWRGLLLTLGVMLPNILGSIGGAEKTNWYTHYHTMYLPFLVWASLEGYARVYNFSRKRAVRAPLLAVTLMILVFSNVLVPSNLPETSSYKTLTFTWKYYQHNPFFLATTEIPAFLSDAATRPPFRQLMPMIKATIPRGSFVGTFDIMMPPLYGWANLLDYPDGLAEADYVIVRVEKDASGNRIYGGQPCLVSQDECAKISSCLTERLRRAGYTTDSPVLLGSSGLAILKRGYPSSLNGKQ